jgi:fused signal recognition particle receptor
MGSQMSWIKRLSEGLAKTRDKVRGSFDRLIGRGADPAMLDELEAVLISTDIGLRTVDRLMDRLRTDARGVTFSSASELVALLKTGLLEALRPAQGPTVESLIREGPRPYVILAIGVNGVGKTTTLSKLAQRLRQAGLVPLLVAADTFRAAAIEQLETWGRRIGVDVIRHQHGADPSAVVFDAVGAAKKRSADVVLIDTAGRLHTKTNLMEELRKIKRVLSRELPGAPHEVLLTLDATVGQNALSQARQFHEAVGVTGLALTKLDGTARGGIVIAIADELKIPVRLIGVGESAEDLQDFNAEEFVEALLGAKAWLDEPLIGSK